MSGQTALSLKAGMGGNQGAAPTQGVTITFSPQLQNQTWKCITMFLDYSSAVLQKPQPRPRIYPDDGLERIISRSSLVEHPTHKHSLIAIHPRLALEPIIEIKIYCCQTSTISSE